jgi:Sec-independent protein translocase protein TatA
MAFLGNLGPLELLLIAVLAVLIFGKDLPQAASKAFMQARKLRNAVDDLRRDSGIEREFRNIERTVREAEWEARRSESPRPLPPKTGPRVPPPDAEPPAAGVPPAVLPEVPPGTAAGEAERGERPDAPTNAVS